MQQTSDYLMNQEPATAILLTVDSTDKYGSFTEKLAMNLKTDGCIW